MVLIPALLVVLVKNVFHSALWLVLSLLGVAGIYAMLAADFLFAVQLMVYAGGIMVILILKWHAEKWIRLDQLNDF